MTIQKKSRKKNWPANNLKEVVTFLEMTHPDGYSINDVAMAIAKSGSKVSSMFIADDMRLSVCEKMALNFGYELHLSFPIREFGPIVKKHYSCIGNLAGLAKYMNDANRSITYIAGITGYSYDMIKKALDTGDIKISVLNKITATLGISPVWKWDKIKEE